MALAVTSTVSFLLALLSLSTRCGASSSSYYDDDMDDYSYGQVEGDYKPAYTSGFRTGVSQVQFPEDVVDPATDDSLDDEGDVDDEQGDGDADTGNDDGDGGEGGEAAEEEEEELGEQNGRLSGGDGPGSRCNDLTIEQAMSINEKTCHGGRTGWSFDGTTRQCVQHEDGSCARTTNKFISREKCELECAASVRGGGDDDDGNVDDGDEYPDREWFEKMARANGNGNGTSHEEGSSGEIGEGGRLMRDRPRETRYDFERRCRDISVFAANRLRPQPPPVDQTGSGGSWGMAGFTFCGTECHYIKDIGCARTSNKFASYSKCTECRRRNRTPARRCEAQPPIGSPACEARKHRQGAAAGWSSSHLYTFVDGKCVPFTYSGCHVTPNMFQSRDQCERVCRRRRRPLPFPRPQKPSYPLPFPRPQKPSYPTPHPHGHGQGHGHGHGNVDQRCIVARPQRPQSTHCGRGQRTSYYMFFYDGYRCKHKSVSPCSPDAKRGFITMKECVAACRPSRPSRVTGGKNCRDSPNKGMPWNCVPTRHITAFSFSPKRGTCIQVDRTDCMKSRNLYPTRSECERRCGMSAVRTLPTPGFCDNGRGNNYTPCNSYGGGGWGQPPSRTDYMVWSFDLERKQCVHTHSPRCGNRPTREFNTKAECVKTCDRRCRDEGLMPPRCIHSNTGVIRYRHNAVVAVVQDGKCVTTLTDNCGQPEFYFQTIAECKDVCMLEGREQQPLNENPQPWHCTDKPAQYPTNTKPCASKNSPGYTYVHGRCMKVISAGCFNTYNKFNTEQDCNKACMVRRGNCYERYDARTVHGCRPRTRRIAYTFDRRRGSCKSISVSECMGSANLFLTRDACERRCSGTGNGIIYRQDED